MDGHSLTLYEKWRLDAESYENGAKVKTKRTQCVNCRYYSKENVLNCQKYMQQDKPSEILFAEKECLFFESKECLKPEIRTEAEKRFFGAVFGFAVGDMLGVPVEFTTRQERDEDLIREMRAYGTYYQPFGSWSDDTSLMLCTMDAMQDGFNLERLRSNMIGFAENGLFTPSGQVFDIGGTTARAIKRLKSGDENPGGFGEADNGNGSLMRILPLCLLANNDTPENFIKETEKVSALTHGHKRSVFACIYYAYLASLLLQGTDRLTAVRESIVFMHRFDSKFFGKEMKVYRRLMDGSLEHADRNQIASTGYVVDTLEAVLWCLLNGDSYEDVVLTAVNLGEDTDTIAALAGGLAGMYFGFDSIPDRWVQTVLRKKEIADLTRSVCNHWLKSGN